MHPPTNEVTDKILWKITNLSSTFFFFSYEFHLYSILPECPWLVSILTEDPFQILITHDWLQTNLLAQGSPPTCHCHILKLRKRVKNKKIKKTGGKDAMIQHFGSLSSRLKPCSIPLSIIFETYTKPCETQLRFKGKQSVAVPQISQMKHQVDWKQFRGEKLS